MHEKHAGRADPRQSAGQRGCAARGQEGQARSLHCCWKLGTRYALRAAPRHASVALTVLDQALLAG